MSTLRMIARLDIKPPNLIKGIRLEGLRKMGCPMEHAQKYYNQGIDELIYMDIVASLYGRNSLIDIVKKTAENIFIPLTVGGGIRSIDDVSKLLQSGADKVALNTAAIQNPKLITEIARKFGSQCVVLSIEAKKLSNDKWEAYTDNGREHTHKDVVEWAKEGERLGAGEILLTSIDQEGTRKGFDVELAKAVTKTVKIPTIISGGMGKPEHILEVVEKADVSAVAIADALHYDRHPYPEIHSSLKDKVNLRGLVT